MSQISKMAPDQKQSAPLIGLNLVQSKQIKKSFNQLPLQSEPQTTKNKVNKAIPIPDLSEKTKISQLKQQALQISAQQIVHSQRAPITQSRQNIEKNKLQIKTVTLDTGGSGLPAQNIALEDLLAASSLFQSSTNGHFNLKFSLSNIQTPVDTGLSSKNDYVISQKLSHPWGKAVIEKSSLLNNNKNKQAVHSHQQKPEPQQVSYTQANNFKTSYPLKDDKFKMYQNTFKEKPQKKLPSIITESNIEQDLKPKQVKPSREQVYTTPSTSNLVIQPKTQISQSRSNSIQGRKLSPETLITCQKKINKTGQMFEPCVQFRTDAKIAQQNIHGQSVQNFVTLPNQNEFYQPQKVQNITKRSKSRSYLQKNKVKNSSKLGQFDLQIDQSNLLQKNLIGNMMTLPSQSSLKIANLNIGSNFDPPPNTLEPFSQQKQTIAINKDSHLTTIVRDDKKKLNSKSTLKVTFVDADENKKMNPFSQKQKKRNDQSKDAKKHAPKKQQKKKLEKQTSVSRLKVNSIEQQISGRHLESQQEFNNQLNYQWGNPRLSLRSQMVGDNADSDSEKNSYQKSNQLASGGTGEIQLQKSKSEIHAPQLIQTNQKNLDRVSNHKQPVGFMLTFSQHQHDQKSTGRKTSKTIQKSKKTQKNAKIQQFQKVLMKKEQLKEDFQSVSFGKRKSLQLPTKAQLYFKVNSVKNLNDLVTYRPTSQEKQHSNSQLHEHISYENIKDILHSLEQVSNKSNETPSVLKPHIRSVMDYHPKLKSDLVEIKSEIQDPEKKTQHSSHSPPTRSKMSQHSLEKLIKQNIKQKEKQKRKALNEEYQKLRKRKILKLEYDAKQKLLRIQNHKQISKEQIQAMKDQLQDYKRLIAKDKSKENLLDQKETPDKFTTIGIKQNALKNGNNNDKASDSQSNSRSQKKILNQQTNSAEIRKNGSDNSKHKFVSRSSSTEMVLWEPEFNQKRNQKIIQLRNQPVNQQKSVNKRDQRQAEIGMEYLLMKKELALALPLNSNQSALLLKEKDTKQDKTAPHKKLKTERNDLENKDLHLITKCEDHYSPVARKLQAINLEEIETKNRDSVPNPKKLVELQKKQWQEKERDQAERHIQEQQRILKNLMSLNDYQFRLNRQKQNLAQGIRCKDMPVKSGHKKKGKKIKADQVSKIKELIKRIKMQSEWNNEYSMAEDSKHRSIKQQSGVFEGQPVFNVQISQKRQENPANFFERIKKPRQHKNRSKSPVSVNQTPLQAATGSASQNNQRKQKITSSNNQQQEQWSQSPIADRFSQNNVKPLNCSLKSPSSLVLKSNKKDSRRKKSSQKNKRPRSQSRQRNGGQLVTIKSKSSPNYKSGSSQSSSIRSPPSLSVPEGISGMSAVSASVSASHGVKTDKVGQPRSHTISYGAVSRTDSQSDKKIVKKQIRQKINLQTQHNVCLEQDTSSGKSHPQAKMSPDKNFLSCFKSQMPRHKSPQINSSNNKNKRQEKQVYQDQIPFKDVEKSQNPNIKTSDLNNEDLVIYIILTQAAKMIQKAWRRYRFKKQRYQDRIQIREDILKELEDKSQKRLSSQRSHSKGSKSSLSSYFQAINTDTDKAQKNSGKGQNVTKGVQVKEGILIQSKKLSKKETEIQSLFRKQTFSFGQSTVDVQHQTTDDFQRFPTDQSQKNRAANGIMKELGKQQSLEMEAGESMSENPDLTYKSNQKSGEKTASFRVSSQGFTTKNGTMEKQNQHEQVYQKLLKENVQGNVTVNQLLNQANQIRKNVNDQNQHFIVQMEAGESKSSESSKKFRDRDKEHPAVFEYIAQNSLNEVPKVFESQFSQHFSQNKFLKVNRKSTTGSQSLSKNEANDEKLIMSYGIDDTIEDQIFQMQKKPKKREKFMNRMVQAAEESSFNASVAEKTDKIINYSAVLNTSEEMIEAAVNQSSTLREHNTEKTQGNFANHSSCFNSSLLHKILPSQSGSNNALQKSPDYNESSLDRKDYNKLLQGILYDPHEKHQIQIIRAISGGDEQYLLQQKNRLSHIQNTSKNTFHVKSQASGRIGHQYVTSVISGSGVLLPSLHSIDLCSASQHQSQSNTKSEANPQPILVISQLAGVNSVLTGCEESIEQNQYLQNSPSPVQRLRSNSGNTAYNLNEKQNISFQNGLYYQNQYSFEGMSHNSLQNPDPEASHGNGVISNNYGAHASFNNSYFLNTNASIFERNPFREYTTIKLHEMLQSKSDVQEMQQMKDDALKYAQNLEEGWITRQEKLDELSPTTLKKRRFELEQWVSLERQGLKGKVRDRKSVSSSFSQNQKLVTPSSSPRAISAGTIEEERAQVARIIEIVNKKSNEIKFKLSQKEISQSEVIQKENQNKPESQPEDPKEEEELEISIEDEEQFEQKEQPRNEEKITGDNEKLADAIAEQILAEMLQTELSLTSLGRTMKRIHLQNKIIEVMPEFQPGREQEFQIDLNETLSAGEQIIAGVDTSIEAVEQYIEGIFAQIRVRGKQFMSAFYTPIYKNPLVVLSNLQRQNIGQGNIDPFELSNTLSSILNVQLYLTLEKARENVIREALQQIKDVTNGENLAQEENLSELLSESDHIHNKGIFDAVNEALNQVRPYGTVGEPMPWSSKARKNYFIYASVDQLEVVLQTVKNKLMEWSSTRAGQLSGINSSHAQIMPPPEKEPEDENKTAQEVEDLKQEDKLDQDSKSGKEKPEGSIIKQHQSIAISEETLQLQREKCLAKLLAQDLIATEEKWTDYENEESQTKLDLADIILEQLIQDLVSDLDSLDKKSF